MLNHPVKIGFAPTKRDVFTNPEALTIRRQIKERVLSLGIELVDIEGINEDSLLQFPSDIEKAVKIYKEAGVDGLFCPHCNFGAESVVARIAAAVGKPVLLWGPRDGAPAPFDGRTRDSLCGLFATGKVLRRFNVPFTYLTNCGAEEESFAFGVRSFAAVCAVVRDFRSTRVLQISTRPEPFWTVMFNEGELLERFGLQVFPVTLQEVVCELERLEREEAPAVAEAMRDIRCRLNCGEADEEQLLRMARLLVGVQNLAGKNGCNSVAIQCWEPLQRAVGAACCTVNGILNERGLPVACETDVPGAVTSILQQAACERASSVFFADLTIRHPDNDNSVLLWHCGNFPPSLAIDAKARALSVLHNPFGDCASQSNWEIRHGDITVCRFDGDHGEYRLMIGEGKGVDGPPTVGTYSWFEVDSWPRWERHLVEGPYIHHCAGAHGRFGHILYEACKYLGIEADPISPRAEEFRDRWLGR